MNARTSFVNALIASRVTDRFIEKRGMEFDSPEALQKYLKEHPDADKSKHTVKEQDKDSGPNADSPKAVQKDMADHLDFVMRGVTVGKVTMDGLKKIKRDFQKGTAKASDVKELVEDLEFDLAKLQDKKDSKSRKLTKQIEGISTFLKNMASKLS